MTGKWIFSDEPIQMQIEDGFVVSISESAPSETYIGPGFFDIQLNGYSGIDYSSDFTSQEVELLIESLAARGTTRHLSTIITNPESRILKSLERIAAVRKASAVAAKAIPGIHIEGPFISPKEGARGVHNPAFIRPADYSEFTRWQEAAEGLIRIVTVSPEDERAIEFIRRIVSDGVIASIGHTAAPPEMIERAIDAGATLSTHLGNGCPAMLPRLKNLVWSQLGDDRVSASIIADGMHLPPEVLRCFTRSKGLEKILLISDVAPLAGSPPGFYQWAGMDVEINESGRMNLRGTQNLAGAAFLLDTCIATLSKAAGIPLGDCVRLATTNPCRFLKLEAEETLPQAGDKADFIAFRTEGNGLVFEETPVSKDRT